MQPTTRSCKTCTTQFVTTISTQLYCSPNCRQIKRTVSSTRLSSHARGYGPAHQRHRREWETRIITGGVDCCLCGLAISATEPWHLDHTEDRKGYRGAAHRVCNLREGQRRSAMTVLANHYGVDRDALASWLEGGGSLTQVA
jgi:hypothetical protein